MSETTIPNNLLSAIANVIRYNPYVYPQLTNIEEVDGVFMIRFPYSELPPHSLLFMLPNTNSIKADATHKNKLRINFASVNDETGEVAYERTAYYDILVEQSDGTKRYCSEGHIVANRLCIFRVEAGGTSLVLVNSPLYNEMALSSLVVTNETTFHQVPRIALPKESESDPTTYVTLVTSDMWNELLARVEFLEQRIQIGTTDPETALAGYPDGTLYVKVEAEEI